MRLVLTVIDEVAGVIAASLVAKTALQYQRHFRALMGVRGHLAPRANVQQVKFEVRIAGFDLGGAQGSGNFFPGQVREVSGHQASQQGRRRIVTIGLWPLVAQWSFFMQTSQHALEQRIAHRLRGQGFEQGGADTVQLAHGARAASTEIQVRRDARRLGQRERARGVLGQYIQLRVMCCRHS